MDFTDDYLVEERQLSGFKLWATIINHIGRRRSSASKTEKNDLTWERAEKTYSASEHPFLWSGRMLAPLHYFINRWKVSQTPTQAVCAARLHEITLKRIVPGGFKHFWFKISLSEKKKLLLVPKTDEMRWQLPDLSKRSDVTTYCSICTKPPEIWDMNFSPWGQYWQLKINNSINLHKPRQRK